MPKQTALSFLALLILLSCIATAAEKPTAPPVPIPTNTLSIEDQQSLQHQQQRDQSSIAVLIAAIIISAGIGIISMMWMTKHSPKTPNLIIHGILFIGSSIWFISMVLGLLFQLIKHGAIVDPDIIQIGWPLLPLLVLSGYTAVNLLKKEGFAQRRKYVLSLTSGGIIATILALISTIAVGAGFRIDMLGVGMMGIIVFTIGALSTFTLGVVGYFKDRANQ